MKKSVLILLIIFIFLSCNNKDTNGLVRKIEKHCNQNYPCQFHMAELINVEWDKVYIFKEQSSLEFINGKLGFPYPYFVDIARRIIFIKNKTVVYHEDIYPSVEVPKNDELYFTLPDNINYVEFPREDAIFTAEKVKIGNIFIYKLSTIINQQ